MKELITLQVVPRCVKLLFKELAVLRVHSRHNYDDDCNCIHNNSITK
jgi:hypothetical protein